MSYGSPPPPGGDERPDPTQNPEESSEGYGSPPPPPPQYGTGASPAPRPADAPQAAPQPDYGQVPPPPPAYEQNPPSGYGQDAPAYGQNPPSGYGQDAPAYGQNPPSAYGQPPPPPPAYGQPGYGAAPTYAGPYEQGSQVGTLALWPQRALGWLIDYVALYIPGYILMGLGGPRTDPVTRVSTGPNFLYYIGALYILGMAIYNRWYRGGTTGQSIGRGVAGVKLVKESTGQPIGPGLAFVRDLAHFVDSIICYVGWLFPLWDQKRQTLADKIMSTVVVTVPK